MEKIIEFVKTNLPVITAVAAFFFAALIIALVAVHLVRTKKADKTERNETVADNDVTKDAAVADAESVTEEKSEEQTAEDEEPHVQSTVEETAPVAENEIPSEQVAAETEEKIGTEQETLVTVEEDDTMKTEKVQASAVKKPVAKKAETKEKKAVETTAKPAVKATKPAAKQAAKPAAKKTEESKVAVGKWIIKEKGDGEFVAFLYANNGELILTSEIYTSEESARTGIETIRKNVESGTFVPYKDKNGNCYFKLKSVKNRILCASETYRSEALAMSAEESVKRFVSSPVQDGVEQDITVIKYVLPKKEAPVNTGAAYSGKWKIEQDGDTYMAKLFASNGELLLNSESYVSYASAKSAISTITTNGIAGNFIIDSDKKGRYFFKLRSAQKATLCIGETYAQLSACQSAIESVRRFLKTAKLVEE